MTEREVESRNPSVCGYCGNGDIESDGVHTCVNSVPDQARAEQPSSDLCPDCGQSLKGAGDK